ncbi:hypothetical protein E4T42_06342 [Aureobasidium subglaciale]|nr:hypothetical protein E4T38_07665 [Aureobasidium subglaciale]KAI5216866.1 hypothetical protein E4T40_07675 [Aureobasidium subglaciale]KAI5220207.1 hypothetical protein E4T41_07590 [Aureobasidium subglaciale]KAI5246409.1 hypothetical protein E4T42_06342 [Aureobasidium subglaciale]KAI5258205.1 hypothetical protein E4T46_07566 [Aureobasidium subglaciale]
MRVPMPRLARRLASTSSKPALKYTGRIPKPAPPPPGPGETAAPESQKETQQARRAIMDAIKEDHNRDYKKRYSSKLWSWTIIICGTPIILVITPYLFRRVIKGENRKRLVDDDDDEDLD